MIRALDVLITKVDKFKGRQEWRLDCSESPGSPLDRFIYHYCMDAGNLGSVELLNVKNKLEFAFVSGSKFDDEYFRRFVRISFANLMRDMVKLMHESELKIRFSNEIATIESHSLFFVFLKVLEFCEYEFDGVKFSWLPWVREKASCNSLERLLLNRLDVIRGSRKRPAKPIKVPHYADVNSFEPCAYEVIDLDGVRMEGDLGALYGCKGYLFSSSSPINTVISSSNGIRLALPGVLAHDIPIRHWRRNHRLLQQAVKQHPA